MMKKFNTSSVLVVAIIVSISAIAEAQPGGGRGNRGGGGFGGGFGRGGFGRTSGALGLVQREDVQKELGVTEDQKADLAKLAEGQRDGRERNAFGNFREMSEEERRDAMAKMRDDRQKAEKETTKKVNEILSGKQRDRFAQLSFQYAMQRNSPEGAAQAAGVELSEDDLEKLRQSQREISEEIQKKIAKIQQEAQIEILKTVLAKSKIDDLMGDEFKFERQQSGRGDFGGGGERGGRGRTGRGENRGRPQRPSADDNNDEDSSNTGRRSRRR